MEQTRQVLHKVETTPLLPTSSFSDHENKSHQTQKLSFTLHPRSSILSHENNCENYTSLTLARLARDSARVNSISLSVAKPHQFESPLTSGAGQGSGEYFARIGVGQPVKQTYFVIDTGSDITWLQCNPCADCYHQSDPIFDPSGSSTYKPLSCSSDRCAALQISACSQAGTCLYQVSYGDGSSTSGDFATETVTFGGGTRSVPDIALGCGHDNEGLFVGAAGLLGLGGGALSLPSQIKATSFSYCLVDRDSTSSSTLEFNSAQPADSILAPLLKNSAINTYYYVGLTGFNVGGNDVAIPVGTFEIGNDGRGGVIVDSGTAVTRLRTEAYNPLRDAFRQMTQDLPSASGFALFDTCYDLSSIKRVKVPTVSLRFAGGKTLDLRGNNFLIPVSDAGIYCFAFAPTGGQLSILGNIQQQGTRVSYNLATKSVGFSPNKC
ncbi:hypothetical protein ACJIZ3_004389 [Penstemon smallii]|uniref:Peptidase A1 domain-containing protein n=1 Tax=Penstemon smallii TaxID=265156 RepID=A0ABD3S1V6_9LAMI